MADPNLSPWLWLVVISLAITGALLAGLYGVVYTVSRAWHAARYDVIRATLLLPENDDAGD